jgi:hypothetical protein
MRLCHAAGSHSIGGSWHASVPIGDFCQTELRPSFCLIGIWKTHEPESQQAVEAVIRHVRARFPVREDRASCGPLKTGLP